MIIWPNSKIQFQHVLNTKKLIEFFKIQLIFFFLLSFKTTDNKLSKFNKKLVGLWISKKRYDDLNFLLPYSKYNFNMSRTPKNCLKNVFNIIELFSLNWHLNYRQYDLKIQVKLVGTWIRKKNMIIWISSDIIQIWTL